VDPIRQYRKREDSLVTAVQLRLDTTGFTYQKWGSVQRCKPGDWLVDNGGEVYSVDQAVFARTYRAAGPGLYRKVTPVWATRASTAGTLDTKEGVTHYVVGDYLVYNEPAGGDPYAVDAAKFEEMYMADDTQVQR